MKITMEAQDYFNELKLMQQQYGQEEDLYPWIYMLLQMTKKEDDVSFKQVAGASPVAKVKGRELIRGYVAFPDIAVFDSKFESKHINNLMAENSVYNLESNISRLLGCVEVKPLGTNLLSELGGNIKFTNHRNVVINNKKTLLLCDPDFKATDIGELFGELLWYGKVLYTNGLVWKFLKVTECKNTDERVHNIIDLRKRLYYKHVELQSGQWYKELSGNDWDIKIECKTIADFTGIFPAAIGLLLLLGNYRK